MKSGGRILWNAITICKMSKTSSQAGNLKYERRSGESFKGPVKLFDVLIGYLQTPRETKQEFINVKEIVTKIFLVMLYSGRIWEEDILIANIEKLEKGYRWSKE